MADFAYAPNTTVLTKDQIRQITQEITPEQVQYVADVKCIGDECAALCADGCPCEGECEEGKCCCDADELGENVVFICKLFAFCDKLRVLHWAATNMSYHNALDDFLEEFEKYKDAIAENIQGACNFKFKPEDFTQITLPVQSDPICVLNEVKQCLDSFLKKHEEDVAYEGCRNATSGMLETVYKFLYIFRMCKDNN